MDFDIENKGVPSGATWDHQHLYIGDNTGWVTTFPRNSLSASSVEKSDPISESKKIVVPEDSDEDEPMRVEKKSPKKNAFLADEAEEGEKLEFYASINFWNFN